MLRVFHPNDLDIVEDMAEIVVDTSMYSTYTINNPKEDWEWKKMKNPYPNDDVMSAAAFLLGLSRRNPFAFGRINEIVYKGGNILYFK